MLRKLISPANGCVPDHSSNDNDACAPALPGLSNTFRVWRCVARFECHLGWPEAGERLRLWWAHQDLNLEPTDYESAALTVELWAREVQSSIYAQAVVVRED